MIGIYKITSPSGKIYIGQSLNVEKRILHYKKYKCKHQIRLHASFNKYGVDRHLFEIILECERNELNEKERYYQDLYQVTSIKGLNCLLTSTSELKTVFTEETIIKMSKSAKGRIPWNKGVPMKEELKESHRLKNVGRKLSNEHKSKIGSKAVISSNCYNAMKIKNSKKIIDNSTGIIYKSITDLCKKLALKRTTINAKLSGQTNNNTFFEYYK